MSTVNEFNPSAQLIDLCVDIIEAISVEKEYFYAKTIGDVLVSNKKRKINDELKSKLKKKAEYALDQLIDLKDNQLKIVEN